MLSASIRLQFCRQLARVVLVGPSISGMFTGLCGRLALVFVLQQFPCHQPASQNLFCLLFLSLARFLLLLGYSTFSASSNIGMDPALQHFLCHSPFISGWHASCYPSPLRARKKPFPRTARAIASSCGTYHELLTCIGRVASRDTIANDEGMLCEVFPFKSLQHRE